MVKAVFSTDDLITLVLTLDWSKTDAKTEVHIKDTGKVMKEVSVKYTDGTSFHGYIRSFSEFVGKEVVLHAHVLKEAITTVDSSEIELEWSENNPRDSRIKFIRYVKKVADSCSGYLED